MRRWLFPITALLVLTLAGCAALQPPVQRIAFPEDEYSALLTTGTATIRGQAFLKTRGGDVKYAAGNEILLNPVTSYSEQWIKVSYFEEQTLTEPDPRYDAYIRKTIGDGEGRFEFTNVPPGDYFIVASVVWEAPVGYDGALVAQGGYVAKRVSAVDGRIVEAVVTW